MRANLVYLAGILMLLSSGAHVIVAWTELDALLTRAGVAPPLIRALATGWIFGSFAMLTFGAILIFCARRMQRGDRSLAVAALAIATCYVVFGTGALVIHHFNSHYLAFIVPGLLAGGSLLAPARR